jgi:hypothetical protein
MSDKKTLASLKRGDVVIRNLAGGGFDCLSLLSIETVTDDGIFVEGADGDFSRDSVYGYHLDGQPFSSHTPGFRSTLLRKATEEDLINYAE